jgi:VCBS repeat-containing protein
MVNFTGTSGNNVANAATGSLSGFTGGSSAQLMDGVGDLFRAYTGRDSILAGSGNDTIYGGAGADTLLGGEGNDLFVVSPTDIAAGEVINGSTGLDTIFATGVIDFTACDIDHVGTLRTGNAGASLTTLNSQTGGSGFTSFRGGTGIDTLTILIDPDVDHENISPDLPYPAMSFIGIEKINIIDQVGRDNSIVGSNQAESIDAGNGDDTISGRGGNDTVKASNGDDSVNGGDGAGDTIIFSKGIGNYSISGAGIGPYRIIDLTGSGGTDTVRNVEFAIFNGVRYELRELDNELAAITGDETGTAIENQNVPVTGDLDVTDPDPGQSSFKTAPVIGPKYGTFSISSSGAWTYRLNNNLAVVNNLQAGETLIEKIKVVSADNTPQIITITIEGRNDGPSLAVPSSVQFAENAASKVLDANATDSGGAAIVYSLKGADAALFAINSQTGIVTFKAPPDFETPRDAGGNNIYNLIVRASNGTAATEKPVAIAVTDVQFTVNDPAGNGNGNVTGHSEEDLMRGFGGNDTLNGGAGADSIYGQTGNDSLTGGTGNDLLIGGDGQDTLTGGAHADRFVFSALTHATVAAADTITDFLAGTDRIDVAALDASLTLAGNQQFQFVGTSAFTGEGQIRVIQSGNETWVLLNTGGSLAADAKIILAGITAATLDAGDFLL